MVETEEYVEEEGKWKKVEPLPKKRWKLTVTTREATKEIEPITLAEATKLSKCLLSLGEPIATTKITELKLKEAME
jgi:hypothetical protein